MGDSPLSKNRPCAGDSRSVVGLSIASVCRECWLASVATPPVRAKVVHCD